MAADIAKASDLPQRASEYKIWVCDDAGCDCGLTSLAFYDRDGAGMARSVMSPTEAKQLGMALIEAAQEHERRMVAATRRPRPTAPSTRTRQ